MEKINVKTLDDTSPGLTATEVLMHRSVITNHAVEIIGKINEIVEWTNKIGERIGLMEDEYKQHLYGSGYTEIQRKD